MGKYGTFLRINMDMVVIMSHKYPNVIVTSDKSLEELLNITAHEKLKAQKIGRRNVSSL